LFLVLGFPVGNKYNAFENQPEFLDASSFSRDFQISHDPPILKYRKNGDKRQEMAGKGLTIFWNYSI
jgi:hypothetical protein